MKYSPPKPLRILKKFQTLKVPEQVNWIKGEYAQYDKKSAFGLITAPFPCANLLLSIIYSSIKNISYNICHYFPRHCANVGPQVKGIDFDITLLQSYQHPHPS